MACSTLSHLDMRSVVLLLLTATSYAKLSAEDDVACSVFDVIVSEATSVDSD
jgi:hypothetical protein